MSFIPINRVVYPPLFLRFIIWMYPSFEPQSSPVFSVYFYRFFAFFYEEIEVEWPVCLPPRSTAGVGLPISESRVPVFPSVSLSLTVDYCVLGARGRQPHCVQMRDWRILGSRCIDFVPDFAGTQIGIPHGYAVAYFSDRRLLHCPSCRTNTRVCTV